MDNRGLFITIEGGDGCGKTTLINNLKMYFDDVLFTKEPGGCEFSDKVRKLIFESENILPTTCMYLFCASRAEHVDKVIRPNLEKGRVVISDRYLHSSLVYQGIAGGLGVNLVNEINQPAIGGLMPDRVIYLRTNKSFRTQGENWLDELPNEELNQIYNGFDNLANSDMETFFVIDVQDKTIEEIFELAKNEILRLRDEHGI